MKEKTLLSLPDPMLIEETAALWIMRLEDGDADPEDVMAFKAWYNEHESHRAAFNRLSSVWGGLDQLSDLVDLAVSDDVTQARRENSIPRISIGWSNLSTGAVAAVMALFCVIMVFAISKPNPAAFSEEYATIVGEQRTIELPDGSSIVLNTNSSLNVRFTRKKRELSLIRGEAFFEVASDKARPFSVLTERGRVTAVGTAFSVRVDADDMGVIVTHGRVALTPVIESARIFAPEVQDYTSTQMEITAGQSVKYDQQVTELDQIASDDIERELDWRDGVLAFRGEPLSQVVRDVSRYTPIEIEIVSDDLKQRPIGGYFKVGETEALFDALAIMADVKVERIAENKVQLYAATQ